MFDKSNDSSKESEIETIPEGIPTTKIDRLTAENELTKMFDFFGLDLSDEEHNKSKGRMIKAFQDGRMEFDIESEQITVKLIKPIPLEGGKTISQLTLTEPTADQLISVDKFEERENMAKAISMTSRITGHPDSIIKRMKSRDLTTVTSVVVLFF